MNVYDCYIYKNNLCEFNHTLLNVVLFIIKFFIYKQQS